MFTVKDLKDILATAVDTDIVVFHCKEADNSVGWTVDRVEQQTGWFILVSDD